MITTSNFQGAMTRDVLEAIVRVENAHETPIYAMILAAGKFLPAKAQKVEWYASQPASRRTQINRPADDYTDVTTTLIVNDASLFVAGDMVIAEATGETMLVQSVNSGANSITVTRSVGSVAAADASVEDDAYLMNIGNAQGEGSDAPAASSASKVASYNFLQTFRQKVEISGRMRRVETMTEDEMAFQRERAFVEVTRDIEHALVYGSRSEALTDANGNKVTTMGGLREMVTTHVVNQGGTMTKDQFVGHTEEWFDTGSREKILAAGPTLLTTLHKLYDGSQRYNTTITNVGLRIQAIDLPHGTLKLVPHSGLRGQFAGDGLIIDQADLKLRPTEKEGGGRLQLKKIDQKDGKDAVAEEIFAEHSLDYGAEQNHAQIRGVTGAA